MRKESPDQDSAELLSPAAVVLQGDAFRLIEELPNDTVDLILTSPPYWGLRSYGLEANQNVLDQWLAGGGSADTAPGYSWYVEAGGIVGLEPYPNWYVAHLVEFFNLARRKIRRSGSLWVNLGDTYFARWASIRDSGRQGLIGERQRRRTPSRGYLHDKQLLMIPARFAIAMQDAGWILRNDLIWSKPHPIPRPERDRLKLSHEHWFHFVHRQTGSRPKYYYDLSSTEGGGRDVVICRPTAGTNGHTATFPTELIKPRILSSCPVGGLVLDPFCGTGRAVLEALANERRGLGFELSIDQAAGAQRAIAAALLAANRTTAKGSSYLAGLG